MGSKALPLDGARERHQGLAALAGRQYGVVSMNQLLGELGYSRREVVAAVRKGVLHSVCRGVFAVGHTDLSPHGSCLAAVFGMGKGALLSHYSAAWLWGIGFRSPIPLHVTSSIPRRPRGNIVRHRARNLVDEDREIHDGVPVTSVARVLLDMAAAVPPAHVGRLLRRSEELELFDLPKVESVIDRNKGHRGARQLRVAVAIYRPGSFQRSGFEERFLAALLRAGIPRPRTSYVELGYELDLYWPEQRFAVELDVFETHGTRDSFESDRFRQEELLLAGIEMVRVTSPRFQREPQEVLARIAALLDERTVSPPAVEL